MTISFKKAKALSVSLVVIMACMTPQAPVFSEPTPAEQTAATQSPSPERIQAGRELVEQIVRVSRMPQIYNDWRQTVRNVTLPLLRDVVEGGIKGAHAPDPEAAADLARLMTFVDYVRRTTDELDAPLAEYREEMITDAATLIAKYSETSDIKQTSELLKQPAVIKCLNAFYDLSKLATGFSRDESRTFLEFSAWAKSLKVDMTNGMPGFTDPNAPPPSPQKVAEAQAIVDDFFKAAHIEDVLADAKRFMLEVYLPTANLSAAERQEVTQQINQYEFTYNFQKSMVTGMAPSILAASLTDEQLQTLHTFVQSPAFDKLLALLRTPIKTLSTINKDEATAMKLQVDDIDRKLKLKDRSPQEVEKIDAQWKALAEKWKQKLESRISPETRAGLEKSYDDLKLMRPGSPL